MNWQRHRRKETHQYHCHCHIYIYIFNSPENGRTRKRTCPFNSVSGLPTAICLSNSCITVFDQLFICCRWVCACVWTRNIMWPWSTQATAANKTISSVTKEHKNIANGRITAADGKRPMGKNKTSAEIISETKSMLANGEFYWNFCDFSVLHYSDSNESFDGKVLVDVNEIAHRRLRFVAKYAVSLRSWCETALPMESRRSEYMHDSDGQQSYWEESKDVRDTFQSFNSSLSLSLRFAALMHTLVSDNFMLSDHKTNASVEQN